MKSMFRLTVIALAAASTLLATGCRSKTPRPNPYQTVLGSGDANYVNPSAVSLDPNIQVEGRGADDVMSRADFSRFQAVLFDFDSAGIRPAERAKVEEAAEYLKANPDAQLLLVGRCDWRGTTEYNMGLGDRRGTAVRQYLGTLGIAASRVEVVSKGDADATEGANESQMQQDRRVDIGLKR